VLVRRPRAGRWRIRALGAGATIRRLALARGLPAPRVRVKVRKARKGRRVLTYRIRRLPGQRVRLYLITVHHGGQTLHRVLTRRRRAGFAGVPATGALRVTVQAISKVTPPSRERRLVVKAP